MILTNLFPFVWFLINTMSPIEGIDTVIEKSVDSIEKRSINECNSLFINYLSQTNNFCFHFFFKLKGQLGSG